MRPIIEKILGIKIDSRIPNKTVYEYCVNKFFCMIKGFLKLGNPRISLGRRTKVCYKRKFKTGKWINISHDVYINALSVDGVVLGNHVSIGCFTRIECTGSLNNLGLGFKCGNNCGLGTNCFYGAAGGIEIGNDVIIGNFVSIHSENHNYNDLNIPIRKQGVSHKGIKIGNNCWIGAKVTFLDGAVLGDGCVVAAGAVVIGAFPDNVVIGGIPAKIIKERK